MAKSITTTTSNDEIEYVQTTQTESDSITLTKNTKGHNWEVKLYCDTKEDTDKTLLRLKQINDKLQEEYGKNES